MNRPLYRPTPRQAIGLAVMALAALAYGFVMRYGVIQNSAIGIACEIRQRAGSAPAAARRLRCSSRSCSGSSRWAPRCSTAAAVAHTVRRHAARGRRRHRALQHGAVVACGRGADPQPGAARVRRRLKARPASVAANHSACQLASVSFQTMKTAHSASTAAATVSASGHSPVGRWRARNDSRTNGTSGRRHRRERKIAIARIERQRERRLHRERRQRDQQQPEHKRQRIGRPLRFRSRSR